MNWVGTLLTGLLNVGGKMIQDRDKQAEFAFKVAEMGHELALKLLETKTYPWIDGLVKLSYASEAMIKGLVRPVFSAGLFIYGLSNPEVLQSLHEMGAVGDAGIAGMFGSFPTWMASRHIEKKRDKGD